MASTADNLKTFFLLQHTGQSALLDNQPDRLRMSCELLQQLLCLPAKEFKYLTTEQIA